MKKGWRNLLVFLAVCFSFIHMGSDARAEDTYTDSGYTYTLKMNDYGDEVATITKYTGSAGYLTIPEELGGHKVTVIGSSVFKGRTDLYMVTIPDTVTEIGAYAFQECTNLQEVELSGNLVTLGAIAFGGCKKLTGIYIPKSLESGGTNWGSTPAGAFADCNMLGQVSFEAGTKRIANHLFSGCDGLKEITIPDTVTVIEDAAFYSCENLKGISVPGSVTEIGNSAFAKCTGLLKAEIGDSVTEIEAYAFQECTNLQEVKLSSNLVTLGAVAFGGCKKLTGIYIPKSLESGGTNWGSTPGGAFADCSMLKQVTFEVGTKRIADHLFSGCDGLKEITIPDTVTVIEDNAFYSCGNLEGISVPESVTEIGNSAFAKCTGLLTAEIGDSVTKIGTYAFQECTNLQEVKLPGNLVTLGAEAFGGCKKLTGIYIPKSLESGGTNWGSTPGGAFADCSMLKQVSFEAGTKRIADHLFSGCDGLKEITIPDTVTVIEDNAFYSCENLEGISVPGSVTEIGNSVFAKCTGLLKAEISDSVTKIGTYVFQECASLAEVKFPSTQKTIGYYLFENCKNLKEISIPDTVETIGEGAFAGAGLTTLEIPLSVKQISKSAFNGDKLLEKVVIPGSVGTIGEAAFQDCVLLTDVSLGDGVKTLGNKAFYGCDALPEITLPDTVSGIGQNCFAECDVLAEVHLGTGLTQIPAYAFYQCPKLKSVVLPYRVTTVGASAFVNCTALTSVTIPRSVTSIADMENASNKVFSFPSKMTIYGVADTYAQEYAEAKEIQFEAINHPVTKLSLDYGELTINKGAKQRLVLSVEPEDFTDEVVWRTTDPDTVAVDESGSGEITAKAVGTATINVAAGNEYVSCDVTVVQPVTDIRLNAGSRSMEALEEFQLTATINPNNANNREIEWSSSDDEIASVDETGLVTAHKKGKATITVKALDGSGKSASCEITVNNTAHVAKSVEEMQSAHPYENNCSDYWVYKDESKPDRLLVSFDGQTEIEERYDSLRILDGDGNEVRVYSGTEPAGQTVMVPGDTVKIQLVSDKAGTRWGFAVTDIKPVSGKLPQELTGTAAYSKTYGDPAFALDCATSGDGELSYTSDNEKVASVDKGGNVTINGAGTAQITVTASETADYQQAQTTVTIKVEKAEQHLQLTCSADTLYVGETLKIKADSETGKISFAAEPESVATVSEDGVVTGVAAGAVNISVTSAGNENYKEAKDAVSLTVMDIPEGSVSLEECELVLASETFVYDGTEKKPGVTVSHNGTTLASGTEYTVAYENNIQPGTARVIVKAIIGNGYYGVVEREFTIKPAMSTDATTVEPYAFSDCDDLYEANIGKSVTEIGDHAFAGCANLDNIYFSGNAPKMGDGVFAGDTLTAWYPADDSTWTLDKLGSYGGNITWKPWDPATGQAAKRSLSVCTVSLADGNYVYDGQPKTPAVTVMDGTVALAKDIDYSVSYSNNINAGAASVTVQGVGNYGGTVTRNFTIGKAAPVLQFVLGSVSHTFGYGPFKNGLRTAVTDGVVSYSSSNLNVATVDSVGTVTIRGAGTAVITAQAAAGTNYSAGNASYTLNVAKATNTVTANDIMKTWSKKQQSFAIGATALGGAALSYSSNNKSVAVDASGRVTVPKQFLGEASVTIRSEATGNYKAAEKVITVAVNPKGTSLRKVKNSGSKKLTVTWKKNADITGYQIQYSTDRKFSSGVKTKNISKKKTVKLTLKKLKKGKNYYVRIRTYKKVGGKKYYSAWSKAKNVKIRK